ncbi:hypothetical protein Nepgr_005403 [Nepenthes gracilis]|uniref:Uncharacterized protein n=1 Tax=Nepenthes gracilis TaxID=150966 RepID=A0AAD3S3K9_NEPGR|nr:hypothetical protein Nepgr_005403 [Nepenthes gracilis]
MQGIGKSSKGPASAPSPLASHMLEEGADVGDEPPTPPVGVSRGPKAEKSIKPIYVLTMAQHGVPTIAGALSKELTLDPSTALVEVTPSDEQSTKGQVGSGAKVAAAEVLHLEVLESKATEGSAISPSYASSKVPLTSHGTPTLEWLLKLPPLEFP